MAFWTEALGYMPERGTAGWSGKTPESIVDPAGWGPRIWFQQVPEPKVVKNRVKVGGGREVPPEIRAERIIVKVERLTRAGATALRTMDEPDMTYYGVVQDPEGNEFFVA